MRKTNQEKIEAGISSIDDAIVIVAGKRLQVNTEFVMLFYGALGRFIDQKKVTLTDVRVLVGICEIAKFGNLIGLNQTVLADKLGMKNNEIANIKHRNVRELHKTYAADMDRKRQKTELNKQIKEVRNAYFNFENDEDELPCKKADQTAQEQATCNFDPVAQEQARQAFKALQQQKTSKPTIIPVPQQEKPAEKKHEYLKLRPV